MSLCFSCKNIICICPKVDSIFNEDSKILAFLRKKQKEILNPELYRKKEKKGLDKYLNSNSMGASA